MKYLYVLIVLLVLAVVSCKPSKEETSTKIDASIKKALEDYYLQTKQPLTTFEVRTLDFEEVGESRLDTARRENIAKAVNTFKRFIDEGKQKIDAYSQNTDRTKDPIFEVEADIALSSIKQYTDSLIEYRKRDSILIAKIQARKQGEKIYYLTNTLLIRKSGGEVYRDTLKYILTKDFKMHTLYGKP